MFLLNNLSLFSAFEKSQVVNRVCFSLLTFDKGLVQVYKTLLFNMKFEKYNFSFLKNLTL